MRTSQPRPIRVACRRHDWTNALFDGRARGGSLELQVTEQANVGAEGLIGDNPAVDYAECGLSGLIRARARGAPVVALPIFIRNAFRHSYIFVRADRSINAPKDLEGTRVGTRYNMTATVWARGLLQHDYGVQLERIHWLNQDPTGEADYRLPPGVVLEPVGRDVDLRDWLVEGRIDGLIHAEADGHRFLGRATVKRLFPDAGQEERNWWRRTHIIPMMNVIACPEEAVKARLDEAREVFDAFSRAKQLGVAALRNNRDSGLCWYWEALEDQLELMGDDPVPYSVARNRHAIETLLQYCAEQGLVDRTLGVEDLFFAGFDG